MYVLRALYLFFDSHVTWNFGAEINAELSNIWQYIGALLF